MTISTDDIKALREETGLSINECRKALDEAEADPSTAPGASREKAKEILSAKSAEAAAKKGDRTLGAGTVAAYVHTSGTIGVLVELSSETDFVSKNDEFKAVARDIAMHVSAMNPADTAELLSQPFIKDPSKTIQDLVNGVVQKFGERTEIRRFSRFSVSE